MLSPDKIKSRFLEFLLENNQPYMAGFKQWVFQPGMEFNAARQWWGDKKPRSAPHEGVDLCRFENAAGQVKVVNGGIRIPAAWAGKIRKLDRDFLGKSIFISHEIFDDHKGQLHTIYGHTDPGNAIKAPGTVTAGAIIGVIADSPERKTAIAPHLHITVAWVPAWFPLEQLAWQNLGSDSRITLLDPWLIF